MKFDMNAAWSRAIDLVKENFQLLIIIAAVFGLLPSVATYLFMPDLTAFSDPNADPEVVQAQLAENFMPLLSVGLFSTLAGIVGSGAMIALMGPKRPTVGQAIGNGFQIIPSVFAVYVLFLIAIMVGSVIVITPFAILGGVTGAPLLAAIAVLPILAMVIYIAARMSMTLPVIALESLFNPISATLRSFKLTHKKQWPITIFWTILGAVYIVIALLFSGGVGVIAALAGGGTGTALILGFTNGLMGMAVGMIMCGLAVAIYQQLLGADGADVAGVFD